MSSLPLWPDFKFCQTRIYDFSANFEAEKHTFTGTASEKSETKTFNIFDAAHVDFIPRDILTEFPNLNGLMITQSNLPTVKESLFKDELKNIEFLWLVSSGIKVIEPKAFQHFRKLQWVAMVENNLQTLPDRIFQNNPDLIFINLEENQLFRTSLTV